MLTGQQYSILIRQTSIKLVLHWSFTEPSSPHSVALYVLTKKLQFRWIAFCCPSSLQDQQNSVSICVCNAILLCVCVLFVCVFCYAFIFTITIIYRKLVHFLM